MNSRDKFLKASEICEHYEFDLYGYKNYKKMLPEDAKFVRDFLQEKYDNEADMI